VFVSVVCCFGGGICRKFEINYRFDQKIYLLFPLKLTPQWNHPGRLTWNLQITHLYRKENDFQTSTIVFHVNLQGFKPYDVVAQLENGV